MSQCPCISFSLVPCARAFIPAHPHAAKAQFHSSDRWQRDGIHHQPPENLGNQDASIEASSLVSVANGWQLDDRQLSQASTVASIACHSARSSGRPASSQARPFAARYSICDCTTGRNAVSGRYATYSPSPDSTARITSSQLVDSSSVSEICRLARRRSSSRSGRRRHRQSSRSRSQCSQIIPQSYHKQESP